MRISRVYPYRTCPSKISPDYIVGKSPTIILSLIVLPNSELFFLLKLNLTSKAAVVMILAIPLTKAVPKLVGSGM